MRQARYAASQCKTIVTSYIKWGSYNSFALSPRSDVQRNSAVNNVDMSSWRALWQNGPYQKQTHITTQKHVEHQDATDI